MLWILCYVPSIVLDTGDVAVNGPAAFPALVELRAGQGREVAKKQENTKYERVGRGAGFDGGG